MRDAAAVLAAKPDKYLWVEGDVTWTRKSGPPRPATEAAWPAPWLRDVADAQAHALREALAAVTRLGERADRLAEALEAERAERLVEHLPGKHDQQTHGSGGGGAEAAGGVAYHSSFSRLAPGTRARVREAVAAVEAALPPGTFAGVTLGVGLIDSSTLANFDMVTGDLLLEEVKWTRRKSGGDLFVDAIEKRSKQTGYSAPGPFGDARDVVVHEMGHALERAAKTYKMDLPSGPLQVTDSAAWGDARDRSRSAGTPDSGPVSDYARTNGAEAFAEAFSAWMAGARADSHDVQFVGRVVDAMRYRADAGPAYDHEKYWRMMHSNTGQPAEKGDATP